MNNLRLAIPITIQLGIRYLIRTGLLEKVAQYCTPIILFPWQDSELWQQLTNMGVEVHLLPQAQWGVQYNRIRREINDWHHERLQSPSTDIDERRSNCELPRSIKSIKYLRKKFYRIKRHLPGGIERLLSAEKKLLWQDTNIAVFQELLNCCHADAILSLTPFHKEDEFLLRLASDNKLKLCTAIHSFDNLTTRGWIPVIFDLYILWNQYNKNELIRTYPESNNTKIVITGAPQFDFYWDESYRWAEDVWRKELGLPDGRPVILFGAGVASIVPHEPHILLQIDQAIESGLIPAKPIILFRRHPMDALDRWISTLQQTKHTITDDSWQDKDNVKYFNVRRYDIERLVSDLHYSQVHVNTSSTMTVDGAIFDKPQIGPAYDDRVGKKFDRVIKELYLREHYLPITNSGGLDIVYSRDQLIRAINNAFENPEAKAMERKKMAQEICPYLDGQCTDRVDSALRQFLLMR